MCHAFRKKVLILWGMYFVDKQEQMVLYTGSECFSSSRGCKLIGPEDDISFHFLQEKYLAFSVWCYLESGEVSGIDLA